MKAVICIMGMALLCLLPHSYVGDIENLSGDETWTYQSCPDFFIPLDITLGDDAFHGTPFYPETWYAEAFFNNSYSMVFIITILSTYKGGLALTGLYLYHNGILEYEKRTWALSPHFGYSLDTPQVTLRGETLLEGWMDKTGKITYNLMFQKDGYGINLTLRNETKGWQGKMGKGWWLAIPELHVEGILVMEGNPLPVVGEGYHDHNIFDLRTPILERGYSDGKFQSDNLSLVWGKILHSYRDTDTLAIMSINGSFISIPQEQLIIIETSYIYDHNHRIPTKISIFIHQGNKINASLVMVAEEFHHIRLPFLQYWRYHVHTSGWINLEGKHQVIDTVGMMEFMLY